MFIGFSHYSCSPRLCSKPETLHRLQPYAQTHCTGQGSPSWYSIRTVSFQAFCILWTAMEHNKHEWGWWMPQPGEQRAQPVLGMLSEPRLGSSSTRAQMTARSQSRSPAPALAPTTAEKRASAKSRIRAPSNSGSTGDKPGCSEPARARCHFPKPAPISHPAPRGSPDPCACPALTELGRSPDVHGGLAVHAVRHDRHLPQRLVVLHPHRVPLPPGAAAAHGHQQPVRVRAALRVQRADAHLARQPHPQPPPRAHRQRPLPRRGRTGPATTAARDGRCPSRRSHSQGRPAREQRPHCRRRSRSARDGRTDGTRPLRAGWRR